jgi:hypothetical protein
MLPLNAKEDDLYGDDEDLSMLTAAKHTPPTSFSLGELLYPSFN